MVILSRAKNVLASIVTVFLLFPPLTHAETFRCAARDVNCLVASMTASNANGPAHDYLFLAAGSYMLTTAVGEAGLPTNSGALTIIGAGTGRTLIARTLGTGAFRLIDNASSGGLTLVNLTLSHGAVNTPNMPGGGCIWNKGSMMLVDVVVRDCTTQFTSGGSIDNDGELLLHHSFVINSRALLAPGGAITSGGMLTLRAGSWLYQSSGMYGGCLLAAGTVVIDRSVLDSCEATRVDGGAIATRWDFPATITITNSLISNNVSAGGNGGGISVPSPESTLHIENSTVWKNTASHNGGGISAIEGSVTLEHVAILFNTADNSGGGVFVGDEGLLVLEESWLLWNEAPVGTECVGPATLVGWNVIGDPGRFHQAGQEPCSNGPQS